MANFFVIFNMYVMILPYILQDIDDTTDTSRLIEFDADDLKGIHT